MFMIATFCSDINDHLYTIEFNPNILQRGITHLGLFSEMYKTQLPKIKVGIQEHLRPAWQLGWSFADSDRQLSYISVRSEDVYQPPGNMLAVYIQSHALNRLAERLDGVDLGILHHNIYNSLNELKVCRNRRGLLMIEYAIFKNKAGYFIRRSC